MRMQPSTTARAPGTAAAVPATAQRSRPNTVVVNQNQRGNSVLAGIKNVRWEYGETLADYEVGRSAGLLFLSLKYHRLHPEYLSTRLRQIERCFDLRILLCLVDIDDHQQSLRELNRVCIFNNLTMILSWSPEEAARYIETLKAYENKPHDLIKERVDDTYFSKLTSALTHIKSVNKTDVVTLSSSIGSFRDIANATAEELLVLPGFAEQKVARIEAAFTTPFIIGGGSSS
eukprot:jgi/Hompol1/5134/HPOL_004173-RA